MKRTLLQYILLAGLLLPSCNGSDSEEPQKELSPYISKVYAYCPAPGQFVNVLPSAADEHEALEKVSQTLVGGVNKGLVTLGAWGGYVVVGFDHPIENKTGEYDFKVYGNASAGSSEPGTVWVCSDVNGNGLPDDVWYELAGSEYHSDSTLHNYCCVYYRPVPADADVVWKDNSGNTGIVARNSYHEQSSYYPIWAKEDSLFFEGTRLHANAELKGTIYVLHGFEWGYADNKPNNTDGACFDIDWAVDANGKSVSLKSIDFVKIQTAQQQCLPNIGETSTEVSGVEILD